MPLFLDVASIACFAFASGMVFVLPVVEKPAYVLLTGLRGDMPESPETRLQLMQTKNVLGQLLAARVPQIKAELLCGGNHLFGDPGVSERGLGFPARAWCCTASSLSLSWPRQLCPLLKDWLRSLIPQEPQSSAPRSDRY